MIDVSSSVRVALRALQVNKLRSALTMLGIIIGVGAVIATVAIGAGAREQMARQIASIGSNLILVLSGSTTAGGVRMGSGTQPTLSLDDAEAMIKECPAIEDLAPIHGGSAQVVYGNQNWATGITGTTANFLNVRDWPLEAGRPFTEQDIRTATKVALIGKTVVEKLFGDIDPVGQVVRIKNVPFTIVGILSEKGQSPQGTDQDDTLLVPVTTAQKKLFGTSFPGSVRTIIVKAKSEDALPDAEAQITDLLRQRHRIGPRQENDFTVRNLTQILQAQQQQKQIMSLLLGAIASVSLLVGGIGIMNIMLVSVTERTREIGIRMAVGARSMDIRLQFIIEAVTLSLIGGIAGIIVGAISSELVSIFAGWATEISVVAVITAFLFSGFVGIFFGFYPAYKASLLNPIDALRYE
ncbi:MAG: FtsX-like permease family protein [Nitrospiraceae bacterium]|jgi:putative ABC transport system permease protein|nr:FtsX-like permease family protein [Nitrospiraceae bacterium]